MARWQLRAIFLGLPPLNAGLSGSEKRRIPMPDSQPVAAGRPNRSTGPKTPEGKRRCRLNAFRHRLTGQLCVFTPEEQPAYEKHSKIILEALAPVGPFEL